MPSNRVKLHALERLDLIDINGIQDLAHNLSEDLTGGVIDAVGMLDTPEDITINNTLEKITFSNFTYLGRASQHGSNSRSQSCFLGSFLVTDSANQPCDFDAVRAATQTYRTTNGDLPPPPMSEQHVLNNHGQYYPYIYIRPQDRTGTTQPRRFWDIASAVEGTSNVDTRIDQYFEFAVVSPTDAPDTTGEYPYTIIARIMEWTVAGGVVSLGTVTPYTLSDSILSLSNNAMVDNGSEISRSGGSGVTGALRWLANRQQAMMSGGSSDPAGTSQLANYESSRYSLAGLEKVLGDRLTYLEGHIKYASAVIRTSINGATNTDVVTAYNRTYNDFTISAFREFSFLASPYANSPLSYPIATSDYDHVQSFTKALGSVAITIPSAYAGWGIEVHLTPIHTPLDYDHIDGDSLGLIGSDDRGLSSHQWSLMSSLGEGANINTFATLHNTVSQHTGTVADGTVRSGYGFMIMNDQINKIPLITTSFLNAAGLTNLTAIQYVKVSITLFKPEA